MGGDFFQIIPHKTDGSVLIVAGDVTGKGLKAGMLVALLVGAIRTAAESNPRPGHVLQALNRRLMGRGDAQATCLALRIAADGAATLANAGHMAPYLNGEPLAMEGALPLGMIEGAESSVMHFQLKHGDKLVLMSDGDRRSDGCGWAAVRLRARARVAAHAKSAASCQRRAELRPGRRHQRHLRDAHRRARACAGVDVSPGGSQLGFRLLPNCSCAEFPPKRSFE